MGRGAAVRRQLPNWKDLAPLLRLQPPGWRLQDRLARAASIPDLRRLADRRAPRAVFDYVDGAAEQELSLRRARQGFRQVEFQPQVLRDVADVDTSRSILGHRCSQPFVLAPTGFTRMMHAEGEAAVARAAGDHDLTYALSTMGTTSIEALAQAAPSTRRWFQLYVWQDRARTDDLVARAAAAGYEALVLTVDTPIAGARLRDVHNGLTIPPALSWQTLIDGAVHPAWWFDLITTAPLEFASLRHFDGTVAELVDTMFDPSVTFDDLEWLCDRWDGPVVVKGIQTVSDAREAAARGAAAVVVSNHGGRQLDRAPTPLKRLPAVVEAVGDQVEVMLDGGIMSGADIVAAVANGATACLVGRAYLYGLMAGGQAGVDRALQILSEEVVRTMRLLGVASVDDLEPTMARLT